MKTPYLSLFTVGLISVSVLSSGCRLKELQQAHQRKQALQQAQINHDVAEDIEHENVLKARVDLRNRIRYLEAVEGRYVGEAQRYDGNDTLPGAVEHVELSVTARGIPAPWAYEHAVSSTELLQQANELSVDMEIDETMSLSGSTVHITTNCTQQSQKPDYSKGFIRFSCGTSGGQRNFVVSLDDSSVPANLHGQERSEAVTKALIDGHIERIGQMIVRIYTDTGVGFNGTLERDE
jgi:hypothetical protein